MTLIFERFKPLLSTFTNLSPFSGFTGSSWLEKKLISLNEVNNHISNLLFVSQRAPKKFVGQTQTLFEQVPPLKHGFGLLHNGMGVSQN